MSEAFAVFPVRDRSELRRFLDVPFGLHRDDPLWVGEMRSDAKARVKGKAYFRRADGELFLAWRGNQPVGRISAHLPAGTRDAFFGFFDCGDDRTTAARLLDQAAAWASEQGARSLTGPCSYTTVEEGGLLVEHVPGTAPRPYHPPYLASLVEDAGYASAGDVVTVRLPADGRATAAPEPTRVRDAARAVESWAERLDAPVRGAPGGAAPGPDEAVALFWRASVSPELCVVTEEGVAVAEPDRTALLRGLGERPTAALRTARRQPPGARLVLLGGRNASAEQRLLSALAARVGAAGFEWLEATVRPGALGLGNDGPAPVARYRLYRRELGG